MFLKQLKWKKSLMWSIFLLVSFSVFSNDVKNWQKLESPETIIKRYIRNRDTTDLGYTLSYVNNHFLVYKSTEIFKLIDRATAVSENNHREYLFDFYNYLRQYYNSNGNVPKSLEYALNVYHLQKDSRNSEEFTWTMVDIGNIFFRENDLSQALIYYQKAEALARKRKDYYALSVIHLNYGLVAEQQLKYKEAIKQYRISCYERVKAGNVKFLASNYVNIANLYLKLNMLEKALKYIHLSEEYYYYKGEDSDFLNETPFFIALAYADYFAKKSNYEKANSYLMKAREIAEYANFKREYFKTFFKESDYYMKQGKFKQAITCLNTLIPMLKMENSFDELIHAYKDLSKCYLKVKNIPSAEKAFENYIAMNDTINHSNLTSQLNTLRTITAVRDSESKLQIVKKNLEITKIKNDLQSKQKKVFLLIFGCGIIVIIVLLLLILNLRKNKIKLQQLHFQSLLQNNEIKIKSNELQRSDQIKDKLFSIIAHDLRNPLNRLLVELAIVKKTVGGTITEPMENTLKETIGLFERLLQWSKMDNKQNVYSPIKLNLSDTINKVIAFYLPEMQLRNITFINNSETYFVYVDPNILQTLLRNFLSNAISVLSNGGCVEIEIFSTQEEKIELIISDSGNGFPEEVLNNFEIEKNEINSSDNGLGLTLCKVLAKMSGWTLKISNNSKHSGAQVSIVLPIFREKKRNTELNVISRAFEPNDFWREKLEPILEFKFYQTSQIRSFLKSLGDVDDPQLRLWIRQVERSVHQGDKDTFLALMRLIE
jgi:tetratricopeptide (TPR) repeat protein/anti-sigma regulatory factor (Ser/Thr protein kinase)